MAMDTQALIALQVTGVDQTKSGLNKVSNSSKQLEKSLQALTGKLNDHAKATGMSSRESDLYEAALLGANAATKKYINEMHNLIDAQKEQERQTKLLQQAQKEEARLTALSEKENQEKQASITAMITSLQQQANTIGMTADEIQIYKAKMMGATEAQLDLIRAQQANVASATRNAQANGKLRGSLQMMRGGLGQVGHQVQDISVQMQMGTNAAIIFGQQGSQIASLFGSGGAIIGALAAAGAAIYTYINLASIEAAKALNTFQDELDKTSTSADGFTEDLRGLAAINVAEKIAEMSKQVEELGDNYQDALDDRTMKAFLASMPSTGMFGGFVEFADSVIYGDTAMAKATKTIDSYTIRTFQLNKLKEEQSKIAKKIENDHPDPFGKFTKSSESLRLSVAQQIEELGKSEKQIALIEAARAGGSDTEQVAANIALVNSYYQQKEALEEVQAEEKERQDAIDANNKTVQDAIDKANKFTEALKRENTTRGMSASELLRYEASLLSLTPEQKKVVELTIQATKAYEDEAEAQKKRDNQAKIAKKARDDAQKLEEQRLQSIDDIVKGLQAETAQLQLQALGLYTATEAQLYYALASEGATAETIESTLALQKFNKELRDKIDLQGQDVKPSGLNEDGVDVSAYDAFIEQQEKEKAALKEKAMATTDFLMTEVEMFEQFYKEKQDLLDKALKKEAIGKQEHKDQMAALEQAKYEDIISAQANADQLSSQMLTSQLSNLSSFFDESSKIGKAFYLVQQGIAATDAIIKGYQAKSAITVAYANAAAMNPDPTGASQAAMIAQGQVQGNIAVGMGYATAGAIAGQTLASFEGGGITFNGVRSGGIDGKGGRMAVVHPNEKITDLEKGGSTGQPVSVQFNISAVDAKGIDQLLYERRGAITAMVQKAVNNQGRRI